MNRGVVAVTVGLVLVASAAVATWTASLHEVPDASAFEDVEPMDGVSRGKPRKQKKKKRRKRRKKKR